ncbi:MAG: hypothetical protein AAF629_12265, partial [Chloroflexota bacterium]
LDFSEKSTDLIFNLGGIFAKLLDNNLKKIGVLPGFPQSMLSDLNLAQNLGCEQNLRLIVRQVSRARDINDFEKVIRRQNQNLEAYITLYDQIQLHALVDIAKKIKVDNYRPYIDLSNLPGFAELDHPYASFLDAIIAIVQDRSRAKLERVANQSSLDVHQLLNSLYWYVRLTAFGLMLDLRYLILKPDQFVVWPGTKQPTRTSVAQADHYIEACMDLYAEFTILQARVNRTRQAVEGIRLARERLPDS